MKNKLLLVDGHSILNRSFYGIKSDMTNRDGLHTNAIYGFINTFLNVYFEEEPEYVFVAFDVKEKTFRHKMFDAYKGQRKPMPNELNEQVEPLKELLHSMNIKTVVLPGYEADDILGTLSKIGEEAGLDVTILSGDRDLLQLASDKTLIRIPKGGNLIENYHTKEVIDKLSVSPSEYIDVKALMGDSSDNIPGVPGIGEKGATNIIVQFKSIENAFEHIEEISPNKAREALRENFELAKLCKQLATINTNAPINEKIVDGKVDNIFTKAAYEEFVRLDFKRLIAKYKKEFENNTSNDEIKDDTDKKGNDIINKVKHNKITDKSALDSFVFSSLMADKIALSVSNNPLILRVLIDDNEEINEFVESDTIKASDIFDAIIKIFNSEAEIVVNDLKSILKITDAKLEDIINRKNIKDISIAAYLINPLKSGYNVYDIARDYMDMILPIMNEDNDISVYIYKSCIGTVLEKLDKMGMTYLYNDIEMPLVYVLYDMEKSGIMVDKKALLEYGEKLSESIESLKANIYAQMDVDDSFNLNSPKQLGEVLFEKMKIPGGKKTKTGYSTSAEVLEKLAPDYPFIKDILTYRTYSKLKSTYADGLATFIKDDGRIHSTFNQTITATGRISSTEPNLQNIPIRMEIGRELRKIFIPKDGYVFVDADYSQIELRVLAHISNDENLIEAYRADEDIHKITASKVFAIPLPEVTKDLRSKAKAVNFGIVYGISSFGLSNDIGISRKEAKEYIDSYFKTYPGVKNFLELAVENAKIAGYVRTMFGRIRPIPELKSSNHMQKMFGERVAMNSPIQGTAADIIKIAMIKVEERLRRENLKSRLILQIHDELLIEAKESEAEYVKEILIEEMQNCAKLKVKLEVDANIGNNWLDAH